jgi:tetratricopeptide (TPR) repeat protein
MEESKMRDTVLGLATDRWGQISKLVQSRRSKEAFEILNEDMSNALNDFSKALVYEQLGNVYQMLDMPREAITALETAIRLYGSVNNPALTRAYLTLGLIHKSMGQIERALEIYETGINKLIDRALDIISKDESNPLILGVKSEGKRVANVSRQIFDRMKELCGLDATFAALRNNMGICYAEMDNPKMARKMFLEAIEFTPKGFRYTHPHSNLAELDRTPSATVGTDVFNQFGETSGNVSELPNGKYVISTNGNTDFVSLLMSSFVVFADDLSLEDRTIFSKWGGLPYPEWTRQHRELFALASMHYIQQANTTGQRVPDVLKDASKYLSNQSLPPLRRTLTPEIAEVFRKLFEK